MKEAPQKLDLIEVYIFFSVDFFAMYFRVLFSTSSVYLYKT